MKPKLLILDGNNNAHRAFHIHGRLSFDGKGTGLAFGFLGILSSLINLHKPDKVIVVWDGKKSPIRLALYPEYKAKRKINITYDVDDFYRQRGDTMKALDMLGISQIYHKDMEADDYIYKLFLKYRKTHIVNIVSSDKDFYQVIPKGGRVITPSDNSIWHKKNIEQKLGIKLHQIVDYHILVGDKSDNIKGIPGIGEVTAKKFLALYGSIRNYLTIRKAEADYSKKTVIFTEDYWFTRELVDLAYFYKEHLKGKIKLKYYSTQKPKQRKRAFRTFCENRGFNKYQNPKFLNNFKNLW